MKNAKEFLPGILCCFICLFRLTRGQASYFLTAKSNKKLLGLRIRVDLAIFSSSHNGELRPRPQVIMRLFVLKNTIKQ